MMITPHRPQPARKQTEAHPKSVTSSCGAFRQQEGALPRFGGELSWSGVKKHILLAADSSSACSKIPYQKKS